MNVYKKVYNNKEIIKINCQFKIVPTLLWFERGQVDRKIETVVTKYRGEIFNDFESMSKKKPLTIKKTTIGFRQGILYFLPLVQNREGL